MLLASRTVTIIFRAALLLVFPQPSHQYTYSCDSSVSCGCSSSPASVTRIVGGESAGTSTWGWAVSIYISDTSLCGGAVLSSSWIITAAHCMDGVLASQVTVYAGSNTRFSGQSRIASSITVHPGYVSRTKVNDIALIQLSTSLTMNSSVTSVCMPSVSSSTLADGEWPPADLSVVAVGWGALSEGGSLPLDLQQVTVQTVDYRASMCSSILYSRQWQFCAGVSGGGKDTCQGDSGGPLMMYTTSQQWVLVGVTSYGIGCAEAAYAGVYTRIAAYQSWIATTTGSEYTNAISSNSANINPFSTTTAATPSGKAERATFSFLLSLLSSLIFILFHLL